MQSGPELGRVPGPALSASFPVISPPALAALPDENVRRPAYHLIDSGMSDNSGWTAMRAWLDAVEPDLAGKQVLLIDIRSIWPTSSDDAEAAWTLELTAPLKTLLSVREARRARVLSEISDWQAGHLPLPYVSFAIDDPGVPLSWNVGRADTVRLREAWVRNQPGVAAVCRFLMGESPCAR